MNYTNRKGVKTRYELDPHGADLWNNLQGSFWGRVSGFDFIAVKTMLKKEPRLIHAVWGTSTPITWLMNPSRLKLYYDRAPPIQKPENRMPKMLRLLMDRGATVTELVAGHFCNFIFSNENEARRCFRILLRNATFVKAISDMKTNNYLPPHGYMGKQLILLHQRYRLRMLANRIWGHKVPSDMMWEIGNYI